jgi:TolB-like protein
METIHEFGPYRLDAEAEMLFRESEPVALGRRAVNLLRLLVERAGTPVSKDALMQAAWPGLAIEESNLTVQIAALRRTFAEIDGGTNWIETLPRRGYRYVGPPVASEASLPASPVPAMSDKPSLAVLPLSNLSGDPAQDYFSDGITGEMIAELSRFRSLFVVARHSSFAYRGKMADIKRIGRELGVRYVAEGSVRKIGRRVRVTIQLLDVASGYNLWTERYDRDLEDIFALQDEIVRAIVAALPGRLENAGREIVRRKPTSSITAYDLVLLGNERWRQLTVKGMAEARKYFRSAVALDPQYARAHANIAWTIVFLNRPPLRLWTRRLARSRPRSISTTATPGLMASSHSCCSCRRMTPRPKSISAAHSRSIQTMLMSPPFSPTSWSTGDGGARRSYGSGQPNGSIPFRPTCTIGITRSPFIRGASTSGRSQR